MQDYHIWISIYYRNVTLTILNLNYAIKLNLEKKNWNKWSLHSFSQNILLSLLFLLLWRPPLRYFLNVAFALLLRKKPSETTFPHRLNYWGNYKIFILPIVQKTARKKTYTICNFHIFWSKSTSIHFQLQFYA